MGKIGREKGAKGGHIKTINLIEIAATQHSQ
jgi:hypothetical protein